MMHKRNLLLQVVGIWKDKHASEETFTSHVFTLMTGTAIGQAISFGVSPALTRLYRPDEFGMFALFLSIASLISVVSAGRYEFAIVLPEKEQDALNVLALSVMLVFAVSIFCFFLVILYGYFFMGDSFSGKYYSWIYYIPFFVFITGLYQCFVYWNNRRKKFKYSSLARITLSTGTALFSVLLGYYGMGYEGLVYGAIIGQISATALLCWFFYKDGGMRAGLIGIEKLKEVAARYSNFPKINVLHALFDTFSASGMIFIITYFFGAAVVGYYSFMMRIIQAPASLVSSSVSQVFYQRASETYGSGGDLAGLIKKLTKRLAALALFPALILLATGPLIFRIVFGSNWQEAGVYAQLLTPYMYLYFIAAPLVFIPFIVHRQKQSLIISAVGNMIFFLSIMAGAIIYNNIHFSLAIYSLVFILYFIGYKKWIYSIVSPVKHRSIVL
jgi:O-antigen/teichoic acid export membrane protein